MLQDLSLAVENNGVLSLPVLGLRSSTSGRESPSLSESTGLATSRSESSLLTVLVNRLGDPLGVSVSTDSLVERIDQDNLVELVGRVLGNPVRVEDTEGSKTASSTTLQDEKKSMRT